MTRATEAFLQRPLFDVAGDPLRLFSMGANATRSSWHKDPLTGMWFPGALLELDTYNEQIYSNLLTSWTSQYQVTATSAGLQGPMGPVDLWKMTEDNNSGGHQCSGWNRSAAQNDVFCFSGWLAKGSAGRYPGLRVLDPDRAAGVQCFWDVDNEDLAAHVNNPSDAEMLDYGFAGPYVGGSYRIWAAVKLLNAAAAYCRGDFIMYNSMTPAWPPQYTGDGSSFVYGGHFQLEDGPKPTSYIEVPAGTDVQRAADSKIEWSTYVPDEFSVQFVFSIPEHTPTSEVDVIYIDDGTANNRLVLAMDTAGKLTSYAKVGGVTKADVTPNKVATSGNVHRGVIAYQRGRLALGVDGTWLEDSGDHIPGMDRISIQPSGALVSLKWQNTWLTGDPRPGYPRPRVHIA